MDNSRRHSIVSGHIERTFIVHAPRREGVSGAHARPLVLAFHGGYASAFHMQKLTRLNELAERDDFIAVYPEGVSRHWNDGRGEEKHGEVTREHRFSKADDVQFVRDLISYLQQEYRIDQKRIYAAGISNGGMFSYRLAAQMADTFAAVASVAGCMGAMVAAEFAPSHPVSVLHIHGTEDKYVPYEGGPLLEGRLPGRVLSVEESIDLFVKANGCRMEPKQQRLPASADDLCPVDVLQYEDGKAGTEVQLYRIERGGHTWPNMTLNTNLILGNVCRDFDGTRHIWEFFRSHPKF